MYGNNHTKNKLKGESYNDMISKKKEEILKCHV